MNILILGDASEAHAAHLNKALIQAGATVDFLDTRLFPTQICISWQSNTGEGYLSLPGGRQLGFQDIHSVFWRNFSGVYIPSLGGTAQQLAFRDSMSTLRTLFKACPARWINSWDAYQFHKEKPLQLYAVKQLGIPIPATLVSNNAEQISEFAQTCERMIFKPVYGGAHTQFVTEGHLEPQRLHRVLRLSPVTIQQYIPGTNIRSFVLNGTVYSAEIRSDSLDFREDLKAELFPIALPESVSQQCLAIAKTLMLEWTAIDWRLKPTGEYVFLEANPSPMFIYFERQTGYPITQNLVEILMS